MGVVYKGYDPVLERYIALKTVRKELVDQDAAGAIIARFKNEALAAGRLTHPGIVGIYDYGETKQLAYIAMEFVQGRGLRDFLARQERFGLQDVVSIMTQLLDALDYAHDHGVVHRDVKPANIIMTPSGSLKVADFGIARIDRSNLTQTGSIMGTPAYMSPEQYSGQQVDRRSDIFSCGVVLYELLTGVKPFEGPTQSIGYKICHEPHRNPSEVNPQGVPKVFDAILAKALAKTPGERYATAREFAKAIAKDSSFSGSPETTALLPTVVHRRRRGRTRLSRPGMEAGQLQRSRACLHPMWAPWRGYSCGRRRRPRPTDSLWFGRLPRALLRSATERLSRVRHSKRSLQGSAPKRSRSGPLPVSPRNRSSRWTSRRRQADSHRLSVR
jgi:serine/threonine-protein kinase